MDMIYLHNLRDHHKDICSVCGEKVVLWSVYRGDTLFGEKVKIPRNQCLKVCSECGGINGKV